MPTFKNYKGVVFEGSTFPDSPYKTVSVKPNATIIGEYIPAFKKALPDATKGLFLLLVAMTHQEGFKRGTRSYRTNNPGNIGNTDSGRFVELKTLEDGIKMQAAFIQSIASGGKKAYPMNKLVLLPQFYSKEIAANPSYGLPANVPGYKFIFTGQLDQFVKIYSTGARATNNYINVVVSYFAANGLTITPESKLQDIIMMK